MAWLLQGAAAPPPDTSADFPDGAWPRQLTLNSLGSSSRFSLRPLQNLLRAAAQTLRRHPRAVTGSIVALLAGTGVTAFGIAPLAPDASDLPRRQIVEDVTPEAIAPQLEALAGATLTLHRTEQTRASDTPDTLLRRLGVVDAAAAAWIRNDPIGRRLFEGGAGKLVTVSKAADGRLSELVARFPTADDENGHPRFARLRVERDAHGQFASHLEQAQLESTPRLASGTIRSSLFAATDEAGLPDAVATQMAEIFGNDIDFRRDLRKGDSFRVVFETLTADGEPVPWSQGSGKVLAAEFVNAGQPHQAVWYAGAGKGGYFDFNGESKRRAFISSPVAFSRVSSGFAMRFHPILGVWKKHLGVDYAAPIGTAVRTVGDGVVSFAGVQNGYGNVIMVQHAGDRMTVYAHLSRIGVRKGQKVGAGDTIGNVGMTGWATGPHLHFEFRLHGEQKDPVAIAKASDTVRLNGSQRSRFAQLARTAQSELNTATGLNGMPGRFE